MTGVDRFNAAMISGHTVSKEVECGVSFTFDQLKEHDTEIRRQEREPPCTWTEDEDGNYNTTCGHTWTFFDGSPSDNGLVFCPFCGKSLQGEP